MSAAQKLPAQRAREVQLSKFAHRVDYPVHLMPHVEQILVKHLYSAHGSDMAGGGSATDAAMRRAEALSKKKKACRRCAGEGFLRSGMVKTPCGPCGGTGAIETFVEDFDTETVVCESCNGSGRFRRKGSWLWSGGVAGKRRGRTRWVENSNYRCTVAELGWCVACRGAGYVTGVDAAPKTDGGDLGYSVETIKHSWFQPTFDYLDQQNGLAALHLDIVYGAIGRDIAREGRERVLALLPFTRAGTVMVKEAQKVYRLPIQTLMNEIGLQYAYPNDDRMLLIDRAHEEAAKLLGQAHRALFAADIGTGARILFASMALDRRKLKERKERARPKVRVRS